MPVEHSATYGDDDRHFLDVYEHLFSPAIELAGYEPVSPISEGSEIIHADIISQLETADMVLCDMSTLNANVFFELGIRTSLDKPVSLVRDTKTPRIPFDASNMNCYSYEAMPVWSPASQIEALAAHIRASASRSGGRNALWKFFGLTQRAKPSEVANPTEEKLDLVLSLLQERRAYVSAEDSNLYLQTLEGMLRQGPAETPSGGLIAQWLATSESARAMSAVQHARFRAQEEEFQSVMRTDFPGVSYRVSKGRLYVKTAGLDQDTRGRLTGLAKSTNFSLSFVDEP